MQVQQPYHLYLDYKGYQIEPRSYRVLPAPLMGTRFASGRAAYSNLDFWQVGAMTDFTHGINQKFLVDPSAFYLSVGIDCSRPGEFKLEKDFATLAITAGVGVITARYRSLDALWLGTSTGKIVKTVDGLNFTLEQETGTGKIYSFFELKSKLFATKGTGQIWVLEDDVWTQTASEQEFITILDAVESALYGDNKVAQSFKVDITDDTFQKLSLRIRRVGTVANDLTIRIETDDSGKPSGTLVNANAVYTVPKAEIDTFWEWISKDATAKYRLVADTLYWIVCQTSGGDGSNYIIIGYQQGKPANYPYGNRAYLQPPLEWIDFPDDDLCFRLFKDTPKNIYFARVESENAYGVFNDGVRRSQDGVSWIPEPPDPLWTFPTSEGIPLNAVSIAKGNLVGTQRGLWILVGGTSGVNLWTFPDYASTSNFLGMERWGHLGLFSIYNQGIFFTEGSQVYPTNMVYTNEAFVFKSCKSIASSGWDVFALVTDGTDWYLARANMATTKLPQYFWFVKKLSKEPAYLASYSDTKLFIFYEDQTAEVYNKVSGAFQASGYLITSLIDENLVRLQKLYNKISALFDVFPISTTVKLGYRLKLSDSWTQETFIGASQTESVMELANPTMGNRIQIRVDLLTTVISNSPTVTDLCWIYILDTPSEQDAIKKNFYFTLIGEDRIENLEGDIHELDADSPRTREDLISALWTSRQKKQILNFIGVENKREIGFDIEYTGVGASCLISIDRTNYAITTYIDGVLDKTLTYKNKTVGELETEIDAFTDYTCELHQDQLASRTAHDLEPLKNLEIKGKAIVYFGSDIYPVIWNPQSPQQVKLEIDGRGSDRINISLREV